MITIKQAYETWTQEIKPLVIAQYSADDYAALAESWNDYTDALCRDGEITHLQYQVCPPFDAEIPDNEPAFILEAMGVSFECERINHRPDNLMGEDPGSTHFRVTIKRGKRQMVIHYSQGSAYAGLWPKADMVFYSILVDTSAIEDGYTFEEWADCYGFDSDSRKAKRMYNACVEEFRILQTLFSESEISDLREIFADY